MAAGSLGGATVRIKIDIPALKKDLEKAKREVKSAQKKLNAAMGKGGEEPGRSVGSKFSKGFARSLTNFISQGGKGGMASIGAEGGAALLGGMSVAILAGAAVVIGAVAIVGKVAFESLKSFIETEKKLIRLQAVFRSTGQSAGFSAEQIKRFAHELGAISLTPDNEILEAAAIIATFQNIVGENFKKAIVVSNDLAIAMGTNQKSAALQLAKALAQPITGLQSLREIGILFTDEQKDMIVEMNRAGRTAEAMNEIFKILAANGIDGNSKATETLSGQIVQLENAYEALKSAIGELLAATGGLADQIKGATVLLRAWGEMTRATADGVKDLKTETSDLWDVFEDGIGPIDGLQRSFDGLGNVFQRFFTKRMKNIEDTNSAEAAAVQAMVSMTDAQLQHAINALDRLDAAEKQTRAGRKRRGAQALLEDQLNANLGVSAFEKRIKRERELMSDAEKARDDGRKEATRVERLNKKAVDNEIKRLDDLIKKEKEKAAVKRGIGFGTSEAQFEQASQATVKDANQRDADAKKERLKALEAQKVVALEAGKFLREKAIAQRQLVDDELVGIREAHELRLDLLQKQFKSRKEEMRKLVKLFMEEFDLGIVRERVRATAITAQQEIDTTKKGVISVANARVVMDGTLIDDDVSKKNRENAQRVLQNAGKRIIDLNKKLTERGIGLSELETSGRTLQEKGAEAQQKENKNAPNKKGQDKQILQADTMIKFLKSIAKARTFGVYGGN